MRSPTSSGADRRADDGRRFLPHVEEYRGTAHTVDEMRRLALAAQGSWPLRRVVESVCSELRGKDYLSELTALSLYVWRNIRYQRDPRTAELIKTPEATLRTRVGDCDDMATLLAALSMLSGAEARFQAVGFRGDGVLSHVFCEARDPRSGRWAVLDPVPGPRTAEMLRRVRDVKTFLVDV